jgi:hypothetical protein
MNAPIACNGHNNFVVSSSKPESLTTARKGKRRNNDFGRTRGEKDKPAARWQRQLGSQASPDGERARVSE